MMPTLIRWIDRTPLWRVFWLYGVLPSNLLWIAVLWMMSAGAFVGIARVVLILLLLYTAWIIMAVWHTAPSAVDRRFGVLAKALTVVWAINTVLLVFFLEVQLLR